MPTWYTPPSQILIAILYIDNLDGAACNFSYLSPSIIGASFVENFGIIGKGKIILLNFDNKSVKPFKEKFFDEGINCIKFNRISNNIIHAGDVEGKLIILNYSNNYADEDKIMIEKIHQGGITSLNTGKINKNLLLSTSLDNSSKIFDINANKLVLSIQNFFKKGITSSSIDYKTPNIISLCSNDGYVLLFDIRNISRPIKCFSFNNPIMTCDFNYYETSFSIGESNGMITLYDLRQSNNNPLNTFIGHHLATKEIKFSPFHKNILCSCGYDMNINVWDVKYSTPIKTFKHHTEFVTGIDFSPLESNILSSISFDKNLDIFKI